jgi:acyl-CoA synthetase (NDP forming)
MSSAGTPAALAPVPAFAFPERAVNALALATRYAEWKRRPAGEVVEFDDMEAAPLRAIVDGACARGDGWLHPVEVSALLRKSGISAPPMVLAMSSDEAMEAAISIGFPVALKAYGPELLHKTDVGGVRLALITEYSVCAAFDELKSALGEMMTGAIVQRMVSGGVEMMLGATYQPAFGHVVACGAGGTLVEFLADVAFRIQPLTDTDAEDLVSGLRSARLLRGYRGSGPADSAALLDAIQRLSALLEICPEIQEIDLNPLKVLAQGVSALDARIRVAPIAVTMPSRRVAY